MLPPERGFFYQNLRKEPGMYSLNSFEDNIIDTYMPLKYDILSILHKLIKQSKQLTIHVRHLDPESDYNHGVFFSLASNQISYYFTTESVTDRTLAKVKEIFSDTSVRKIFFNAAAEMPYLESMGCPVKGTVFDILTVDKILGRRRWPSKMSIYEITNLYLEDIYEGLPVVKLPTLASTLQKHLQNCVLCINFFSPLRKKMINELEECGYMDKATAALAKFNKK